MMRVMGLDASTTTIGIAIIDYNKSLNLVYSNYYKPDKSSSKDILPMITKARAFIIDIAKKYKVDTFVIEDYIRFMKGGSTASTIIPLSILNMSLRLAAMDMLNLHPNCLNVNRIRHAIKFDKKSPKKEEVPDVVSKHLNIEFPWIYKFDKRKKQEVKCIESYDIADAIAVALAYILLSIKEKK